jgi:hypothetical protein
MSAKFYSVTVVPNHARTINLQNIFIVEPMPNDRTRLTLNIIIDGTPISLLINTPYATVVQEIERLTQA